MGTSWLGTAPADAGPTKDDLRAALAPGYVLARLGRPATVRRTWLDTYDGRLRGAGLILQQVSGPRTRELSLSGADGTTVTATGPAVRWPARAEALPPPLRGPLRPVTGVRALLPVARAAGRVSTWRVLCSDDTTVAWLSVDRLAVSPGADPLTLWLTVTAAEGRQSELDGVIRCLTALPALVPATPAAPEAFLTAAGRAGTGDAPGAAARFTGSTPAPVAVAAILLQLLGTLEANVDGTVRDIDVEFLHDLRVSVRRTRSALKLAGHVLPEGLAARYRGEFTWLGDATTPTRDLDVHLLNYPSMAAGLVAATPAELAPFHDHLVRRRAAERARLLRALRSRRFADLTTAWRAALSGVPDDSGPAVAVVADHIIRRAHRRVLVKGAGITPGSAPELLHDLRKRCKELRYALEFFAPLHDPQAHQQAVRVLKKLQDCLGTFQDCQVQRHEIQTSAGTMLRDRSAPAATLLAMGELAAQAAQRQQYARSEFTGRFARFAGRRGREQFGELTAGSS